MQLISTRRHNVLLQAVAPLLIVWPAAWARAAVRGGQVVAGSAAIAGTGSSVLVRQSTNRAIINWSDFSTAAGQSVQFVLPSSSSAVLNRVTSSNVTTLNGMLLSNGSVYLINPNGIIMGPSGRIDVHGFVASTLDVNNAAFLAGGSLLFSGSSLATVDNQGAITAAGGDVVLIARQVRNGGQIAAPGGSVTLAGGTEVLLQQATDPGLTVRVIGEGSATNSGVIDTTLAQLAANGGNAFALAINNTGIIRATGVQNSNGHIYLTAGPSGAVSNSGTLDASSSTGQGGQIVVTGQTITIGAPAILLASGPSGGGEIFVGGSWEGTDSSVQEALTTTIERGAVLNASATESGDGGTIVVRSDVQNPASQTSALGSFFANGGPEGGNGGRVETSGFALDTAGAQISASSINGQAGEWLLDPYNVTISSNPTTNMSETGTPWEPTFTSNIDVSDIDSALNGGSSVTIYTGGSNGGGDLGNITVNAAIAKTSGSQTVSLTLQADNNIVINSPISASSGELSIVMDAHMSTGGTTAGVIILGSSLSTNGGSISFGTGRTYGGVLIGGDVYLNGSGAQALSTVPSGGGAGGNVSVYGQMLIANPSGLTISTAGGTVDFEETVDSGDSYALGGDGSVTWTQALADAQSGTASGTTVGDTYLATITTSLQNQIAANAADYQAAWLGGHRPIIGGTTSQTWYWVAGPLGQANGGVGTPFFLEDYTDVSPPPEGTAINGSFTNWNNGEPNNSGGANTTVDGESALEFVGNNALWNDLNDTSPANPYVVETNLAPSPLTINSGAGQVTFKGLVGSNKPLATLTVTGPVAMNGGGVTTTGAQTYENPMTLGATATILAVTNADLNIGQNITYSASSAGSLTLQASGSVTIATAAIAATGSGALNVTIDTHNDEGTDTGNSGAIVLSSGASIASNGGTITLGGGIDPSTTPAYGTTVYPNGIDLNDATLNSNGGNITLGGTGITSGGTAGAGVLVDAGSTISSGTGTIAITGIGASSSANANDGLLVQAGSIITTTSGPITLVGTGGGAAATSNNSGIAFNDGTISSASGPIVLQGIGGTGTNANASNGISFQGTSSQIQSTGSASISLVATAGSGAASVGLSAVGPAGIGGASDSGNISVTSNTVSLDNAGAAVTFQSSGQLLIQPMSAGTSIGLGGGATGTLALGSAALGNIHSGFSQVIVGSASGTGAVDVGTASISDPVTIRTPLATANDITVNGTLSTPSAGDSVTLESGRSVIVSSGSIQTSGAAVTLDADSDSALLGNIQVIDGSIATSGGAITLGGGSAPASTPAFGLSGGTVASSSGVFLNQATLNSAGGNISIDGTGSTSATPNNAAGVMVQYNSTINSGTGAVAITGVGPTGGTTGNMGVNISYENSLGSGGVAGSTGSSIVSTSTSAGAIQISGTGSTSSSTDSAGVALDDGSSLTATGVGGGIVVNGVAGTLFDNSSPGNHGINLEGGAAIDSVSGNVTLNASSPAGLAAINNFGAGSAAITAGGALKLNPANDGVNLNATVVTTPDLLLAGSGAMTLTDAYNAIGTIAGSVSGGNVQVSDGQTLAVGQVGGISGVTDGGGSITLTATGASSNIVLNDPVAASGTGTTVVLAAGQNFIDNVSGSSGIQTGSGRFLVYSTTPADDELAMLGGGHIYDRTYLANPPGTITETGNQFLYSIAPSLTVTANDQSKVYGQSNPTLTYSVSGLFAGDTLAEAITGTAAITTAPATSGAGNYAINVSNGSLGSPIGYTFNFVAGQLTITPAPLTITASNQSRQLFTPNPALTSTINGLVNGDTSSSLTGLELTTTAVIGSPAGQYPIEVLQPTDGNYSYTLIGGTLLVGAPPTPTLQVLGQTQTSLAPNFPPSPLAQPMTAPTAQVSPAASGVLTQLGFEQGYLFYRPDAPVQQDAGDYGTLSIRSGGLLFGALVHVSSFDQPASSSADINP